jgi:hypothetical protein
MEGEKRNKMVYERFIRWTMGVDWRTSGYMIKSELGREKMRRRTNKKAISIVGILKED